MEQYQLDFETFARLRGKPERRRFLRWAAVVPVVLFLGGSFVLMTNNLHATW